VRTLAGATQDEVRRHNLGSLLRLLHVHGAASRSDLTALTGLNRSTVGVLTTELADAGLVREDTPVGRGGAGRPSIVVRPESQRVYVLALDVGVDHLIAARVGLGGQVLDRRDLLLPRRRHKPAKILADLDRLSRSLLAGAAPDSACVGVGVGVCGVVSREDGLVRFAPNLAWVDVPFGAQVADRLGTSLPVVVGNDADLGAVAEHVRGAARDTRNLIYLSGEVGVGGGIILDGQLMSGAGGYGGEVGHMVVHPKGKLCRCGARGCWETEVGEDAALAAAGIPGGTVADLMSVAAMGDRDAAIGLRKVGRWLGIGVANLVNIFNPEVVVFGGLLRQLYPITEPMVRTELARALAAPRQQVRLAVPALGGDSTLLGAAETAFAPLLDDPIGALGRGADRLLA
jgi:predicted NBD/HSP70 family sugar kinase